uniref:nicotinamidase n=1 Tax=Tetradesmus obliquus TaxID=3088 RepID=A0A383W6I0_TETOB|eukprot:jgi/Sobl393_1/4456/SZX72624.1
MAYLCLQGCFLPGGALPTAPAGSTLSLVKAINTLRTAGCFDLTVFTQDWHPPNHISFAAVHSRQPLEAIHLHYTRSGQLCSEPGRMQRLYPTAAVVCRCNTSSSGSLTHRPQQQQQQQQQHLSTDMVEHQVRQVLWPQHCLQHSTEARLHPGLIIHPDDVILRKGWQPQLDAYSAFQDNGRVQSTGLAELLREHGISSVVVVGVALEVCVKSTALDAVEEGFETAVVLAATAPVDEAGAAEAVQEVREAGVRLVQQVWDVLPAPADRKSNTSATFSSSRSSSENGVLA